MKEIDKILNKIEGCILGNYYESVETEKVELKPTPPNLKGAALAVLAYFYKSEKANLSYRNTILLTTDNNHANALVRLEKSGLVFKHPESADLYPVFLLHRDLMRDNYYTELRNIFGGAFDLLSEINKQTLSLICQVNNYDKSRSISATQAGRLLFYKTNQPFNDIKAFDNFKRKIYGVFKKLAGADFLTISGREYYINKEFSRSPSLFDGQH